MTVPAQEALRRLREGNERFVSAVRSEDTLLHTRKAELTLEQEPIAIVLGCSDARVPAEIVFDQGLGDLFVIRVAGNIVAPSQVGSVEFAAERFGTQLVVVLGHTQCGAILATLDVIRNVGRGISAGIVGDAAIAMPEIAQLLLPRPAVAGIQLSPTGAPE